MASKVKSRTFLLLALICVAPLLKAQEVIDGVPTPQGLIPCSPQSPLIASLTRMIGQSGTLDGCFVSREHVQIQGSTKVIDQPLQFGFAITASPNPSGPFTTANIDALYSKTQAEWNNVAPTWSQSQSTYEQGVKDELQKSLPNGAPQVNLTIPQPLLISMERIDPNAYIVISVRQRQMTMNGNIVAPVAANGYALILRQGHLVRLTLERQVRSSADVDAVKSETVAWAESVRKSAGK
jgi:hypothetical protein